MAYQIRRVAVIGAGTMGAAIAGLVAGAGLPVLLLDIPPKSLTDDEAARGLTLSDPAVRNRIVRQGFERMRNARPANLFSAQSAELITLGNTEDDFAAIVEADWIVEAIIEKLELKQALMARIEARCKPDALISTNTSGIPIAAIGAGRNDSFRKRLLGTHFFNPPRYLKLLELIPGPDTDPAAVATMRRFGAATLGKGVVLCKDRPNFIGNRLGIFSLVNDLNFILANGYTVEEVDALTGPLIGRPSTATFRLIDQVGVDVVAFVAQNIYTGLPDDESRAVYSENDLLARMVQAGMLGKKSGAGFYKEVRSDGKRVFYPLDLATLEHRPPGDTARIDATLAAAQKIRSLPERLRFLVERAASDPQDNAAQLVAHTLLPYMAYAARRLPEIADSIADADNAMRWGFAHQLGPFEIWDALGLAATAELMRKRDILVAPWVTTLIESGADGFYTTLGSQPAAYNVAAGEFRPIGRDPRAIDLAARKAGGAVLQSNASASLLDLGDGVLGLEFHSKANAADGQTVAMGLAALAELQNERWIGMVVGNQGRFFCAGANLGEFAAAVQGNHYDLVDQAIGDYQRWVMGMRHAPKPVVTAPFGMTLGGGCEIALHGSQTVAAAESYIGLVEMGVGLIPAAGGCKELNRRLIAAAAALPGGDPLAGLQRAFELISQAKVSGSAVEAREWGFLRPTDRIIMNGDFVLGEAKQAVQNLAAQGYTPPPPGNPCYALGRDGLAAARIWIYSFVQAGYASAYDAVIADKLAYVLCGGELSSPQWVSEQYILDLERHMFMELLREPQTHARIEHMLKTGKPLRN